MSAGSLGGDENEQDFEINLAPIIDCFTVLITYMLVSASFISLSSLDIQMATASDQPADSQPSEPQVTLTLEITATHEMRVILGGKTVETLTVKPTPKGEWDLDRMTRLIETVKAKAPALGEVTIKAEPTLEYKQVVKVLEGVKKSMPKVFLGE